MKRMLICLALLMSALPVLAGDLLPRDVQRFVDRRESCDHMREETPVPGEKLRMAGMERELSKQCKGTGQELARLKRKYAANTTIMQVLNQFETGIEATDAPAPTNRAGRRAG